MTPSNPDLLAAAAAAAGAQQYPPATLYVVATPIGNLADLTLRSIHVLGLVDAIACEDTRVSAGLLRHLGIDRKPLLAVHQHNELEGAEKVIERLARGERVACVSDAGTPGISDPGARLVAAVAAAGYRVLPIPGACSPAAAVSAAGDALGRGFAFIGFLPSKGQERRDALAAVLVAVETQVLFEAPHRIEALASACAEAAPQRPVTLCRELTKQFESIVTLPCGEMPAWFAGDAQRLRGEFVLVLHARAPVAAANDDALPAATEQMLQVLLRELPLKQAVSLTAELCGAARNALYDRALALRNRDGKDS